MFLLITSDVLGEHTESELCNKHSFYIYSGSFMVMLIKIVVLWPTTPCNYVEECQHIRATFSLSLYHPPMKLYGVKTQKPTILLMFLTCKIDALITWTFKSGWQGHSTQTQKPTQWGHWEFFSGDFGSLRFCYAESVVDGQTLRLVASTVYIIRSTWFWWWCMIFWIFSIIH
jgi:hypothetical protein